MDFVLSVRNSVHQTFSKKVTLTDGTLQVLYNFIAKNIPWLFVAKKISYNFVAKQTEDM